MTVIDQPMLRIDAEADGLQRFVFTDVDWDFYEKVGEKLTDRRVFATYYKGRLEVVTVSLLHERITALLVIMVRVMAEGISMPLGGAGMTTLKRLALDAGIEADSSFYTAHELEMRGKTELNLEKDPPPDLAIEVEVTRRLGVRRSIYRDLGVPEFWIYSAETGLIVLIKHGDSYSPADCSPTFPMISPQEITQFVGQWV